MHLPEYKLFSILRQGNVTKEDFIILLKRLITDGSFSVDRWDDLRAPATQLRVNPTINKPVFDYTNVGYVLPPTENEPIYIIMQLPHSYKEGSDIVPHVHWQTSDAIVGNVKWSMEYKWTNVGDVEEVNFTPISVIDNTTHIANKHQATAFPTIKGTNKKLSSMLVIKLCRDAVDPLDTYPNDILLREFDLHYLINSTGSVEEYLK